jgi:hypothetical protein
MKESETTIILGEMLIEHGTRMDLLIHIRRFEKIQVDRKLNFY